MAPPLTPPKQGDDLSAGLIAALIAEVQRLSRDARGGAWGSVAALLAAKFGETWVQAVITRVYPSNDGAPRPAGQVTYDVVCVGQPSTKKVNVQPDLGRPTRNPLEQIHAARVNDPAVIIHTHDADGLPVTWFLVLSEVRATRICGS